MFEDVVRGVGFCQSMSQNRTKNGACFPSISDFADCATHFAVFSASHLNHVTILAEPGSRRISGVPNHLLRSELLPHEAVARVRCLRPQQQLRGGVEVKLMVYSQRFP